MALRRTLQTTEDLQWLDTPSADLIHYRHPNGWEVLTDFGALPLPAPRNLDGARIVPNSGLLAHAPTQVPGETTFCVAS